MSTAVTKTSPADISGYTSDQVALIKSTIAVGATNDELMLFLQVCKNHKLDPFTRQIHFVKRAGKGTIQISIDGFRAIAERTGNYAGNDDPVFDDEQKPQKATATVWKMVNGVRCPFNATARWSQYFPGDTQGFMWKKMPHVMLGKCAEALALRKAFPEALSGLYSDEEMDQANAKEEKPKESTTLQPSQDGTVTIPANSIKEGSVVEVALSSEKTPKMPPTAEFVAGVLTKCEIMQPLQLAYDQAFTKYAWAASDADKITKAFLDRYGIIMGWLLTGAQFWKDGLLVGRVEKDDKGKAKVIPNVAAAELTQKDVEAAEDAALKAA